MSFKKVVHGVSVVMLLLLVVFLVPAAGGRQLAGEKTQKDHYNNAEGTEAPGNHLRNLMVRTNDYGRYDPTPAFSKPRFKPIPH